MDSKKETYKSLPQEVLSVGHRIGLQQKNEKNIMEAFVQKVLPNDCNESELRFTTYLLNEKKNSFNYKTRVKQKKCKNGLKLSSKERKRLFALSESDVKYETFERINHLWHKYIDSVVNEIKSSSDEIKLIRADFHGSYLVVSAAKNPTLVGVKGFVVNETKNTFKIVNKDNRLLTVPKDGTVFAFEHNGRIAKLNGYNLKMSSHHRSKIKPKLKLNERLVDI